jgi:P-type Cu2+ transporter
MTLLALPSFNALQATPAATTPEAALWDDSEAWDSFTTWSCDGRGRRLGRSTLAITGMHCAACSLTVEALLQALPGVHAVQASAAGQRAAVVWDPTLTEPARWLPALQQGGYAAVPDCAAATRDARQLERRQALWRCVVAALCSMQVMMLAAPSYVAGPPELSHELARVLNWGQWVLTLPVLLFSARPLFAAAWHSWRQRRMAMEVPVVIGIVVTFVASTAASFDPQGRLGDAVYFDSLTMFISLLLGARWLEMSLRQRAATALEAGFEALPRTALRVTAQGQLETVNLRHLRVGDQVQVPLGEAFPADGQLCAGNTQVDEALLSGESVLVDKDLGHHERAQLWAGTLNRGQPVRMRVQRIGADTRLATIGLLVRQAMTQRPASARLADRWATPFLIAVMVAAVAAALVWSQIDPSRAWPVAVAVLIVTCPCALSLAVPAAQLAATQGLASQGVIVQRLQALETWTRVSDVLFDKTGTLTVSSTDDEPMALTAMHAADDIPQLWAHAAALASASTHHLSRALLMALPASTPQVRLDAPREQAGCGVEADDEQGRHWRLGSAAWVGAVDDGVQRLWLARGAEVVAGFALTESLRPGAAQAVAGLRAAGLRTAVLSGDGAHRTQSLAQQLHIDDAVASASPEHKLQHLRALQQRGAVVAMVGDGINDSPVLAGADVSLAMGQGAVWAREHADFVLTRTRLDGVLATRQMAFRTQAVARLNLAWAALYNLACIPLALVGWLPPWAAGLGMATSSLLVVANAARLSR